MLVSALSSSDKFWQGWARNFVSIWIEPQSMSLPPGTPKNKFNAKQETPFAKTCRGFQSTLVTLTKSSWIAMQLHFSFLRLWIANQILAKYSSCVIYQHNLPIYLQKARSSKMHYFKEKENLTVKNFSLASPVLQNLPSISYRKKLPKRWALICASAKP